MKGTITISIILIIIYIIGSQRQTASMKWMNIEFTNALKGISIFTVVWAHVGATCGVGGIQFIAGIGVSLFLICSGYGLECSYDKNGLNRFFSKRLLRVCFPFWIIELIGLMCTGRLTIYGYLQDFFFIKPATGYGWFMGYIVVWYIAFYAIKKITEKYKLHSKSEIFLIILFAGAWFVLESLFLANPEMPFLRARQMLSFPLGILIAKNYNSVRSHISSKPHVPIIVGGTGIIFMALTQLKFIKEMPYIVSNLMALFTVLPLAIVVLAITTKYERLINNMVLIQAGIISYDIYLIHAFTLQMIKQTPESVLAFTLVTVIFAMCVHAVFDKISISILNKGI